MLVGAVIQAAGFAERMGGEKMNLDFGGRTVLQRVVDAAFAGGALRIVVVTNPQRPVHLDPGVPALQVENPTPERGQRSSLHVGLEALWDGLPFFFTPGDMPLLREEHFAVLIAAMQREPQYTVFAPTWKGRRGHPVLMGPIWKERLLAEPPEEPLRNTIRARPTEIRDVPVPLPGIRDDIDTPEEYERLLKG